MYRINHISWWEEEMPNEKEMAEGRENLELAGNKVDFIITHCAPSSSQAVLSGGFYEPDKLTKYLESIKCGVNYKYWLFGHYHIDKSVTSQDICLFEQIVRIN